MSELSITGTIKEIFDLQTGKSSRGDWVKTSFLLTTEGEYPKDILFGIFGAEKVDKFMQYNEVGSRVEVFFNPSSNEYNGKYYTNLDAWMIKKAGESVQQPVAQGDDLPFDDDLPFGK